ncbi:hypothetical protein BC829DRAFT_407635 [Chytridium lagenaria]|nr:hypothetical protein BC829DRAFT_407635 [Chytridium lagenaria]
MDPSYASSVSPADILARLHPTPSATSISTTATFKTAICAMHYLKALYDFAAKEQEELPMEEEDIIANNGAWGWFPESYVRILTDDEASAEGLISSTVTTSGTFDPTTDVTSSDFISPPLEPSTSNSSAIRSQAPPLQPSGWFSKYKPRSKEEAADTQPEPRSRTGSDRPKTKAKAKFSAEALRSGKGVSIVGTPAEMKKTWAEFMGGAEVLDRLQISKQERKRQEVVFEILSTEKDYVDDLNIIIDVYIKPLKKTKLIRPKDMSVVFSNIEAIAPVNRELLKSFETRQSESPNNVVEQVGDIFIGVSDYLKMYTMYCSNHPYALMKLQAVRNSKGVAKFLDQCAASQECRNMALSHYLLKPVQRICKYPLLLREMIRNTDADHPDFANLQKALSKIETVVTIVNEGARQAEVVHKMIELQNKFNQRVNIVAPSRTLKKSGTLNTITPQNERKRRDIFLFNDMLLMAKPSGAGDNEKLKLVAMVPFDMILVNSLPEDMGNLIEIVHINASKFTLEADSKEAKEAWIGAFQEATNSWMALKKRGAGVEVQERVLRTAIMSDFTDKGLTKVVPPLPKKKPAETSSELLTEESEGGHSKEEECVESEVSSDCHEQATKPVPPQRQSEPLQRALSQIKVEVKAPERPHISTRAEPKPRRNSNTATDIIDSAVILTSPSQKSSQSIVHISLDLSQPKVDIPPVDTASTSRMSFRLATNYFIVQDLNSHRPAAPASSHLRSVTVEAPAAIYSSAASLNSSISPSTSFSNRLNLQVSPASTPSISPSPSFNKYLATASRPVKAEASRKQNGLPVERIGPSVIPTRNLAVPTSARPLRTKSISEKPEEIKVMTIVSNTLRNSAIKMESVKADNAPKAPELSTKKPNINRPVKSATIMDVTRKTEKNGKDFVYTLRVQYVGQAESNVMYIVQHTYEDFFEFHLQLIGHFPEEAGVAKKEGGFKGPSAQVAKVEEDGKIKRIVPELPGQMMVVSEAVAKTRIEMLQNYIQAIISLPAKISRSPLTMQFFRTDGKHAQSLHV